MSKTRLFSVVLVVACAFTLAGCGDDTAEPVTTPDEGDVSSAAPEVETTRNGENFSMSFKGKDGKSGSIEIGGEEGSFTMNIDGGPEGMQMKVGNDAAMPDNFPKDVPVYNDLKLNLTQTTNDGIVIQGTVTDDMDTVSAFFKEQAVKQGWEEQSSMNTTGDTAMTMLSYTKGDRTLNVTVTRQDNETMIQIITSE